MTKKIEFTYKWNLSDLKNVKKNKLKVFSCFACGDGYQIGMSVPPLMMHKISREVAKQFFGVKY